MEKNTMWAIGLSTVVLVGFMALQTYLYPNNVQPQAVEQAAEITQQSDEQTLVNEIPELKSVYETDTSSQLISEQKFTITTDLVNVVFTNRGGDIVSYELLKQRDSDTGRGIEMADNVTEANTAFSLTLGKYSNKIIDQVFETKQFDDKTIGFYKTFTVSNADGTTSNFTLVKKYTFKDGDYAFKLDVTIDGDESFKGLDFNGTSYVIRTSPQVGPHFDPKVNRYESRTFISYSDGKKKKNNLSSGKTSVYDRPFTWAALAGKYFEIIAYPVDSTKIAGAEYNTLVQTRDYANAQISIARKAITEKRVNDTYYFYVGPRNEKELNSYNIAEKNKWQLGGVHFNESLQTSGILSPIEAILKIIMELIHKVLPNWGLAIILMTVLLKLVLYPVTKKSLMGTQKMSVLQPRMQALQEKYKENPQKLQQETAKLYKEVGYNPMSGCLPMLIQFIILFAMYNLFNNYFEFRGSEFIHGWIDDLSVGDSVYTLSFNLPLFGNQLRALPVIYVVSQLLFGKVTGNGGTTAGQAANQMKMMMYGMPIMFFFLFYNAPSGLLLYWTVSNLIQLVQQLWINRIMKKNAPQATTVKAKIKR